MDENGRSRFRRTTRLVHGLLLLGFGGLLVCISVGTIAMFLGRIRDYHSFVQYAALGTSAFLGLIGFLCVEVGMVLCRLHHQIPKWRMLIGLLTGLETWFFLAFCGWLLVLLLVSPSPWDHFRWIRDRVPVLVAGCLAGYIARKRGLLWGGIIGATHQVFVVYIVWKGWQSYSVSKPPRIPLNLIIQRQGLFPSILMSTATVLLVGMASGYLGQFLAHKALRRRKS
jgi:hypothetical protein